VRLGLSKSQIEKLGTRLVAAPQPAAEDLDALHRLLEAYGEVLAETVTSVRTEFGASIGPGKTLSSKTSWSSFATPRVS
jgi:hypothetical protein